jgi:hypothetical protein
LVSNQLMKPVRVRLAACALYSLLFALGQSLGPITDSALADPDTSPGSKSGFDGSLTRLAPLEKRAPSLQAEKPRSASGLTLYSIGQPTDEEQLYLEYINRARRDPAAEGIRLQSVTDPDVLSNYQFYGVDLTLLASQLAAISSAPPLSMSAQLAAAARGHSLDMLTNAFQGHNGSDGSMITNRATNAGYFWDALGENVFSYAHSVEEGHDGFEADWGGDASTGGMQSPPHHRLNIHDTNFVEVGIGVIDGTNGMVGPQVVTEDFGNRPDATPFITGVVFYDLNGNGTYDLGEGLGGVTVTAPGSSYYAITANSGGYSVPVPANGTYPVTFSLSGLADAQFSAMVAAGANVKIDYHPRYAPPTITGADQPAVNHSNAYSFSAVPGATAYQWKLDSFVADPFVEGAEDGLSNVTVVSSPGYSVLDSDVVASGANSFHLAHPGSSNSPPSDQSLMLNGKFRSGPATQLSFSSRLGWATPDEVAHAQTSTDGGQNWQDVWTQAGSGDAGEMSFTTHSVSLEIPSGQLFQIRFVYSVGGSFFPQPDPGVGLYLDNITVQGADELVNESINEIATGTSFNFDPPRPGLYTLSVRPQVSGRLFAFGPEKSVVAQTNTVPSAVVQITSITRTADGHLAIGFTVGNPGSGVYQVEAAPEVTGSWATDSSASVQIAGANAFQALVSPGVGPRRFYRVVAQQ